MTDNVNQLVTLESLRSATGQQTIDMRLVLTPTQGFDAKGGKTPTRGASVDVLIDGVPIDCGAVWDLLALVASGREPGRYYLGNCGCGEPQCAGIGNPVNVTHDGDCVTWEIPMPYVRDRGSPAAALPLVLTFDGAQYKAQTEHMLSEFRNAATDGGPRINLDCYPGNLPEHLLSEADKGWPGYGGREVPTAR